MWHTYRPALQPNNYVATTLLAGSKIKKIIFRYGKRDRTQRTDVSEASLHHTLLSKLLILIFIKLTNAFKLGSSYFLKQL